MEKLKTKYVIDYISGKLRKKPNSIVFGDLENIKEISFNATDIAGNYQSTHLSDLRLLTSVEDLDISNISLSADAIQDICALENLQTLNLRRCEYLGTTKFMFESKKLESLGIYNTMPKDIGFLKDVDSLSSLTLSNVTLMDLGFIKNLPNLKSLDLTNSKILDLNIAEVFKNIQMLNICDTNIKRLDFLNLLPNLTSIYINHEQYANSPQTIEYLKQNNVAIYNKYGVEYFAPPPSSF